MQTDKAVVLARGLGSRMRKPDSGASLNLEQARAAWSGIKAMIPVGRPFLDYVLSSMADAGFRRICLVIGPGPEFRPLRDYYDGIGPERVSISYAIQKEPRGTADAVAAAEAFAGKDEFAVVNSDNYYPPEALGMLRETSGCATVAFEAPALSRGGNIPPSRIARYALLEPDRDFFLERIVEKPSDEYMSSLAGKVYVSMNCWRFSSTIFEACRKIGPSVRGEYEIASAVHYAMDNLDVRFRMLPSCLPVLDMTGRSDIAPVAAILSEKKVLL